MAEHECMQKFKLSNYIKSTFLIVFFDALQKCGLDPTFDLTSRRGKKEATHSCDSFDPADKTITADMGQFGTGLRQGRQQTIVREEVFRVN